MKLSIYPYTLRPISTGVAARQGALLRLEEDDCTRAGYADIHPWPELGDLDLDTQLNQLARGQRTPLTSRSLCLAREDGRARGRGRSLFAGYTKFAGLTKSAGSGWPAGDVDSSGSEAPTTTSVPAAALLSADSMEGGSLAIPASHATFSGRIALGGEAARLQSSLARLREEGFRAIKLKVGLDLEAEAKALAPLKAHFLRAGLKLRLDFNERSPDARPIEKFLLALGATADWIDWLEDPFRFDARAWAALRHDSGLRIALDRPLVRIMAGLRAQAGATLPPGDAAFFKGAFDLVVLKPAVQDPTRVAAIARGLGKDLVVTSYLDHPLGQVTAAWEAARAGAQEAGLITHTVYEPSEFSETLSARGPILRLPSGTGFGWDDELAAVAWEAL